MKKRTVKTGFGRDTKKKMKELYRDYTRISDEVTILKNPHKGFYYHYIDNGFTRPTYKNGIKYDKEIYDFSDTVLEEVRAVFPDQWGIENCLQFLLAWGILMEV